ncbi:MAG: hypothetical protein ACOCPN_04065 [Desulfonatronovibrionaceae bacterium]
MSMPNFFINQSFFILTFSLSEDYCLHQEQTLLKVNNIRTLTITSTPVNG